MKLENQNKNSWFTINQGHTKYISTSGTKNEEENMFEIEYLNFTKYYFVNKTLLCY